MKQFEAQQEWLLSLITDPKGERRFITKEASQRRRQFEEQLARMGAFLTFAGDPHTRFQSVHVAGTSGKGSVTAMIAAILSACGRRTGHHVSPYLQSCVEKLIIDGQPIRPSEFNRLVDEFRALYAGWTAQGRTLRYGEAWVALTFLWFAAQQVEWAVIETGLGGRYDPTNVLPSSLAVITDVGLDHVVSLGPGLADIARHKAGIIKEGRPAITSVTVPDALAIIRAEAEQKGAPLYELGGAFDFTVQQTRADGSIISVETPWGRFEQIPLGAPGLFQQKNAATAIAAAVLLDQEHQIGLTSEIMDTALQDFTFPGRMEIVQHGPLTILDGAHNSPKMGALVESLRALYPSKEITAVVGLLADKEAEVVITRLVPLVTHYVVTEPQVFAKPALPMERLAAIIGQLAPQARVSQAESVDEAVELGLKIAAPDGLLLITGSLYLVGAARERWYPTKELLLALEKQE